MPDDNQTTIILEHLYGRRQRRNYSTGQLVLTTGALPPNQFHSMGISSHASLTPMCICII